MKRSTEVGNPLFESVVGDDAAWYYIQPYTLWVALAMNEGAVHEFLCREPFEPFVIRMSIGESHEVRHPECAIVATNRVVVYNPSNDRIAYCALIYLNAIESLQTT